MKTILFLLLIAPAVAVEYVFTNMNTSPVLFTVKGADDIPVFVYVPSQDSKTLQLPIDGDVYVQADSSGFYDYTGIRWTDIVSVHSEAPDVVGVYVVPGWSWWDVGVRIFWAFCAYYAAKLLLRAVQSLWKMPEP